jgi:hypothetical protein
MKKFVFRCFDANASWKLSEQDLFKVMKSTSPAIYIHTNFHEWLKKARLLEEAQKTGLAFRRAILNMAA